MDAAEVKARARGRWASILQQLGVDAGLLDGKGHPCPACRAGRDRFTFTDRWQNGDYFCRHCGHGDGFQLLQACLGLSFREALARVAHLVGCAGTSTGRSAKADRAARLRQAIERIWREASAVTRGDAVDLYLAGRGLRMAQYPAALRCHPRLAYYERADAQRVVAGFYPAMIAPLVDADGRAVALHRTYLSRGRKADVPSPKKVLGTFSGGPAIRLFEPTEELAITEGIETALAVHLATGKAVWAAYSATNMEKLELPGAIRRLSIYADNDASFSGIAAAYALAKRARSQRPDLCVEVHVPKREGEDWADVFLRTKGVRAA